MADRRREHCLIVNPRASATGDVGEIVSALQGQGRVRVCESHEAGEAAVLAREAVARGCRRIVAAGGDGTLNEVLDGIAPAFDGVELGVVPWGTGNDFARAAGVGPEPATAIAALAAWQTQPVDVVRAGSEGRVRHLLNSSSGGFSTAVGEALIHEDKEAWGALAYMISAARAIPELRAYRVRVSVDGEELWRDDCLNVVVANGPWLGGGICLAADARLDDGLVHVVLVPDISILHLGVLVSRLMAGDSDVEDQLITRRGKHVRLEAEPALVMNADGEPLGSTPVVYEVLPGAIRVVTGPGADRRVSVRPG